MTERWENCPYCGEQIISEIDIEAQKSSHYSDILGIECPGCDEYLEFRITGMWPNYQVVDLLE